MKKPLTKLETSFKTPSTAPLKRFQNWANTHHLWFRGDALLVGISGGPDSVCLLHILSRIAKKSNLTLYAIHVNYHLRGNESDSDEQLVRTLCTKLAITLFVYAPRVPKKISENTLRILRYKQFKTLGKKLGCSAIAVGHNKNDQAETLLLHLFRGCGVNGMKGMSPKKANIIRPLLNFTRKDILSYLKENSLPFREDSTNNSLLYTRNIIRHKIIPLVQKSIQPNIVNLLAQSALLFSDDAKTLESLNPLPYKIRNNICQFSQKEFVSLSPPLQNRFLKKLLSKLRGSDADISLGNINEIKKALTSRKSKDQYITFLGLIYKRKNDTVSIRKI